MWKVSFSQTGWSGNLTSRLGWVVSSSCELMVWLAWDFCPVVQQLAWLFSSPACLARVPTLAAYQPRVSTSLHNLEHFFTLSHSLPLHNSHLNTGLLIAKIQANLVRNKANKIVDKIQPYIGGPHNNLGTKFVTELQEQYLRVSLQLVSSNKIRGRFCLVNFCYLYFFIIKIH